MKKKFYGKNKNFKIWHYDYSNKHIINIYKYLTFKELDTLKRLGIIIENKLYTKKEFESIDISLYEYYKVDERERIIETVIMKKLGISLKNYIKILGIFNQIYIDYDL